MFARYLVAYLVPDVEIFGIRAGAIGIGRRPGTGGSPRRGNLAGCQRTTWKARRGNKPLSSALQAVIVCTTTPEAKGRALHTIPTPQQLNTRTISTHLPAKPNFLIPLHIIRYTGHYPIHRTSPDTPDIIRYIGHYLIHRTLSDTPDTIRYIGSLASFLASATKYVRSTLFWDMTQSTLELPYRRFETTYRSHLQAPRRDRQVVPNRLQATATIRCVISQENAYLTTSRLSNIFNTASTKTAMQTPAMGPSIPTERTTGQYGIQQTTYPD